MSEFLPKPAKLPESVLDELQAKVLGYYRNAAAGQPIGPLPAPAEPTEPTDVTRQTPYTREPVQTILPSDKGLTAALDGLEAKVRARQPAPAAGATQDIAPVLTPAEPPLSEPAKRAIQGALTALEWHKTAARWASLGQEKEAERKRGEEEAYQVYVKGSEQRAGEGDYERQKAMARDRGPQGAGTPALKLARGMPEPTQDEVANWPKEAGVLVRTKMKALEKEGALDEIASLSQKYRGAAILSQRRGVGGAGVEILEKQLIDPLTSAAASAITFSGNPIWAAWEFAGLMAEDAPQPRAERLENFIRGIPRSGAEFTVTTVKQTIKGLVNPDNIVEFGLTVGAALFYLRIGWKVGKTGVRIATAVRDRLVKAGVDRKVAAATARAASATLSGPKPGIGGPEQVVQQLAENLAKELGAKNPLFNEARAFILSPEGKGYVGNVVRSWHAPSTSRGLALPAPTTPTGMRYLYSGVALPPEVVTALTKLNVTAVVREGVAALSGVTPKTVAGVGAIMAQAGMTFNPATNTAVPQAGAEKPPAAPEIKTAEDVTGKPVKYVEMNKVVGRKYFTQQGFEQAPNPNYLVKGNIYAHYNTIDKTWHIEEVPAAGAAPPAPAAPAPTGVTPSDSIPQFEIPRIDDVRQVAIARSSAIQHEMDVIQDVFKVDRVQAERIFNSYNGKGSSTVVNEAINKLSAKDKLRVAAYEKMGTGYAFSTKFDPASVQVIDTPQEAASAIVTSVWDMTRTQATEVGDVHLFAVGAMLRGKELGVTPKMVLDAANRVLGVQTPDMINRVLLRVVAIAKYNGIALDVPIRQLAPPVPPVGAPTEAAPPAPREPSTRLPLPSQIEPTVTEVRERTALKERLATHKKVAEAAFREGKAGGSERTAAERDLIRRESERRIKLAALKGRLREQVRTQVARERVAELLAQKKDRQANAETALVIVKEIIGPDAELLESNDYKILRERIFGTKKFMRVATIEQVHETMAWAEQLLDKAETGALRHLVAGQLRDLGTAQKSMEEPYRSEARRLLAAYQRAEPAGPKVGELESRREYVTRTKESAEVGGEQFNPELLMPTKYLEELRRLGQKPISELSREELTVLSDGIEWNEMGSKRLATARAGAERLGLENRADAAVEEMRRARPEPLPEHKIPGTLGQRAKGLEDTLGTISHDIPTLHDAVTTKLFEAENNTAGVKIELLNALVAVLERPFGGNVLKAHKFMGKLLTVLTPGTDRRSVTRSVADWMTFYVDSMANRFEMLKSGYTFRPSQQKGVTGPNEVETAARPWLVTQETIDAVARQLPRAAKQMADGLLAEIFNRPGLWERSEAAFFAVKGRHREAAAVYAPRRRSGLQRPSQQLMPGEVATEFFLDSLPQFQERTGSSLSLVGDPILGRALSFIEATSRMIGEGAAVRETAVLLGLPSVRAEMISRYGQPVYDNMTALVAHGANEGLAPTGDVIDRWFRGGARRFTDAVLSWNPSTGFVQIPSSILYNLNEFLGAKQYAQAVAQVGRHPLRFYKEMIANVPMAALRYHVLSADIQGLMTGTPEPALALRVKRRFAKVGMKHLLAGDAIALTIGYRGFVLEAAARGLGLDWAARQFVTTTNETQLSASRFNRTPLQVKARESPALTGLSLFRNQLAVNRNLLVRAIENARNEPGGERGRANWRNLFKTVGLLVAQQLAIAFIHSGFAYLRSGGDKEKLKLRWILRDAALGMAGISVLGRELVGIALQLIQFDKRGVRVDVLGSPVVQALNRTAQGIVGLVRAPFVEGTYGPGATYAGESKAKIALLDAADGLAYGLGGLTGTPISPYTYTKAALKWTSLGARDLVLRLTASSLAPEDALSIADQLRSRGYSLERAQKWLASHDEKYKLTFHDMAQRELRLEKRWHATPESQAEELEFKQLKREQRKIE